MKALSPNNMIGKHLTTQNRVMPPKKPNKDKGHHKDKGNRQQRITGKALLPKSSNTCTIELSSISMKQVQQSRSASLTRLHTTADMSSDNNLEG
jgi:hypothetical protein